MAKFSKSMTLKAGIITRNDDGRWEIEEITRDGSEIYSLDDILSQWEGMENVTLTIKQDSDILPGE